MRVDSFGTVLIAVGLMASAALAATVSGPPVARPSPGLRPVPTLQKAYTLSCSVGSFGQEWSDTVILTNLGPNTVPKGAKVRWTITEYADYSGEYIFLKPLPKSGSVGLHHVLRTPIAKGHPCTAK
jgi:hypothetical protein